MKNTLEKDNILVDRNTTVELVFNTGIADKWITYMAAQILY